MAAADDAPFDEIRLAAGAARARLRRPYGVRLCAGHFPDEPLLPGAGLAALMAEVAARLVSGGTLVEIERCLFRARVRPDTALHIEAERTAGPGIRIAVTARADGRVAAQAILRFAPGISA